MFKKIILYFILLLNLSFCWGDSWPNNTQEYENDQVIIVGGTTKLECIVEEKPENAVVVWKKQYSEDNTTVLAASNVLITRDPRISYTVSDNQISGLTYKLRIKNVQESDAAKYLCIISNPNSSETVHTEIDLKVIPRPTITYFTEDLEVNVGDTVELKCITENAQGFFVGWLRFLYILPDENPPSFSRISTKSESRPNSTILTITIEDVQEHDAGKYQCHIFKHIAVAKQHLVLKVKRLP